jgi:hypothetical protein
MALQDDEADSFMQHALAPSELWQTCIAAWRRLSDLGEAGLVALSTKLPTYA